MSYQHDPNRRHPLVDAIREWMNTGEGEKPDTAGVVIYEGDLHILDYLVNSAARGMLAYLGKSYVESPGETRDQILAERDRLVEAFEMAHRLNLQSSYNREDSIHWFADEEEAA